MSVASNWFREKHNFTLVKYNKSQNYDCEHPFSELKVGDDQIRPSTSRKLISMQAIGGEA